MECDFEKFLSLCEIFRFCVNSIDIHKRNAIPTVTKTRLLSKVYCDLFVQITIKVKRIFMINISILQAHYFR
ncbi:hypothetical protein BDA96_09G074700 [Sorghum bicolor]|uniref:Uncharacterized protein n=1 Tax=Sorghum bicolor TaxID=4558 RepID=A0A921U467_SORBI|nr:hypothetical protein BDA96_09G074700 [Sorghum bicolor]